MKTYTQLHILPLLVLLFGFSAVSTIQAQQKPDKSVEKLINKGLKAYDRADYEAAELNFRKALAKEPVNATASYDLGLTETELEKPLEAAHFFKKAAKQSDDASLKSKAYFNEGNVWYQKQKYEKAVEAYKNALRQNPNDEEARYNLALAIQKLKQQQKKNKKNQKQNKQNKQKNKNQKNKDQKNQDQKNKQNKKDQNKKGQNKKDQKDNKGNQKDQNKQGQNKKDQKGKGDQKKDQQKNNQNKEKKDQQGQNKQKEQQPNQPNGSKQQPKEGQGQKRKAQLTPQQVKQLLVALKNKEQKTQKKVKAKILKGRGAKHKQDKDW
jgi:tetratricopeptide (TPR) repeat protein